MKQQFIENLVLAEDEFVFHWLFGVQIVLGSLPLNTMCSKLAVSLVIVVVSHDIFLVTFSIILIIVRICLAF